MEKPSFDQMFRRTGKFQDSIWWASEERKTKKPRFVRPGGIPKNENPKIRAVWWASDERKPKDKDSFGWTSEERKKENL
ncbi:unnamed protein product [Rhizophagus irregularis]|nr:unnamed protein product [Rhizophagus irregularis]